MALIEREMPVTRIAQILGVHPQRIWTVFDHWVGKARANDDPSSIKRLGVDETSSKKRGIHMSPLESIWTPPASFMPRKARANNVCKALPDI